MLMSEVMYRWNHAGRLGMWDYAEICLCACWNMYPMTQTD